MFVDIPAGYQGTISPKWFRFLVALLVILIIVLAVLVYRNRYPSVSSTGSVSVSSGPDTDAERRASEIRKQLDGIAKRDAGRPTPAPTAADIQAQLDTIAKGSN